ncbi:hypothetical protein AB1N83_013327 [Pleurotus pulmonarius]
MYAASVAQVLGELVPFFWHQLPRLQPFPVPRSRIFLVHQILGPVLAQPPTSQDSLVRPAICWRRCRHALFRIQPTLSELQIHDRKPPFYRPPQPSHRKVPQNTISPYFDAIKSTLRPRMFASSHPALSAP